MSSVDTTRHAQPQRPAFDRLRAYNVGLTKKRRQSTMAADGKAPTVCIPATAPHNRRVDSPGSATLQHSTLLSCVGMPSLPKVALPEWSRYFTAYAKSDALCPWRCSMKRPVLVVHGVANHERDVFAKIVNALNAAVGADLFDLIPVFWGDLGAQSSNLPDVLPQLSARRGEGDAEVTARLLFATASLPARPTRRGTAEEVVAEAAMEALQGAGVRRGEDLSAFRDGIHEAWGNALWLKEITDEDVLRAVGEAIGKAILESDEEAGFTGRRWDPLHSAEDFVKGVVHGVDGSVVAAVGVGLGTMTDSIRAAWGPNAMEFLGDAFVYQRKFDEIQGRLWEHLDSAAPGYGTQEKPIDVIAHSFGGLITLDAAVAAKRRLWIGGYVTFGSQPAFFHLLEPRGGDIVPYTSGTPVRLPRNVDRWTNLWEPMDPLAFIVSKVFLLHTGQPPQDIMVS